jgi:acetyltransferase-like isoleucine patch superfamily enzyme/acyl carrier protein
VTAVRLRLPRPLPALRTYRDRRLIDRYKRQGLTLGQNFICHGRLYISEPHLVTIGDNVACSANVTFIAHEAAGWHLGRIGAGNPRLYSTGAPIVVHDDCAIGFGAIILAGVSIGPRSIVGAGSVVHDDVPPDTVVAGNPARAGATLAGFARGHLRLDEGSDIRESLRGLLLSRWPGRFSIDQVADDVTFDDDGLGLDSVEVVEFVLECEERFGVRVANELVADGALTIDRLAERIGAPVGLSGLADVAVEQPLA